VETGGEDGVRSVKRTPQDEETADTNEMSFQNCEVTRGRVDRMLAKGHRTSDIGSDRTQARSMRNRDQGLLMARC
jgi:hypothetical protein